MVKPGSKKQNVIVRTRGSLGESDSSDDSSADFTAVEGNKENRRNTRNFRSMSLNSKPSGVFHTPENDSNATDYGLEFTTSHIQNPSPRRCSTLKTASSQEEEQSVARGEGMGDDVTAAGSRVNEDLTDVGSSSVQKGSRGRPKKPAKQPAKSNIKEQPQKVAAKAVLKTAKSREGEQSVTRGEGRNNVAADSRGNSHLPTDVGSSFHREMTTTTASLTKGSPKKATKQPVKSNRKQQPQKVAAKKVLTTGKSQEEEQSVTRGDGMDDVAADSREMTTTTTASLTRGSPIKAAKQKTKQPAKSSTKQQPQNVAAEEVSETSSTSDVEEQSVTRGEVLDDDDDAAGSLGNEYLTGVGGNFPIDSAAPPTTSLAARGSPKKATKQQTAKSKGRKQTTQDPSGKTTTAAVAKNARKQRTPMQLDRRFWREVKNLQNRTDLLIPRLPFSRVIREIIMDCSQEVTQITPTALEALQTASEMYTTQRLQDAYMLTLHRGRVTLDARDMELINYLKMYL